MTKHTFELKRRDGVWEKQVRQTYDRGHAAVILPYDPARGTVLLVRQFRLPVFLQGHKEPLIEACAGLLDDIDPETCIRKEAQEELGYRLGAVTKIYDIYMSPGSVTERLSFFTARLFAKRPHFGRRRRCSRGRGYRSAGDEADRGDGAGGERRDY